MSLSKIIFKTSNTNDLCRTKNLTSLLTSSAAVASGKEVTTKLSSFASSSCNGNKTDNTPETTITTTTTSEIVCYIFTIYSTETTTPTTTTASSLSSKPIKCSSKKTILDDNNNENNIKNCSSNKSKSKCNNNNANVWFEADSFMRLLKCEKQFKELIKHNRLDDNDDNSTIDKNNNSETKLLSHKNWPINWLMFWDELCIYLDEQSLESMFKCRLKCDTLSADARTRHQLTSREFLKWCEHTVFVSLECIHYLLLSALTTEFVDKSTFTNWLDEFIDRVKCRHSSFHIEYVDLLKTLDSTSNNDALFSNNKLSSKNGSSSLSLLSALATTAQPQKQSTKIATTAVTLNNNMPNNLNGAVGVTSKYLKNDYADSADAHPNTGTNNETNTNTNYTQFLTKQFETILSSADEYKMLIDVPLMCTTNSLESTINTTGLLETEQTTLKHQPSTTMINSSNNNSNSENAPESVSSLVVIDVGSKNMPPPPPPPPLPQQQQVLIKSAYEEKTKTSLYQQQQQQQQRHLDYMQQIQNASILYKYLDRQEHQFCPNFLHYGGTNSNHGSGVASVAYGLSNTGTGIVRNTNDTVYSVCANSDLGYPIDTSHASAATFAHAAAVVAASNNIRNGSSAHNSNGHGSRSICRDASTFNFTNTNFNVGNVKHSNNNNNTVWWYWATNVHLETYGIVHMGCTNNPEKRMMILNMGAINEYRYLALFQVNNRWLAEKLINDTFREHHLQRGFYKFDISETSMQETILKYMRGIIHSND